MLTVETDGARALLGLLACVREGYDPAEAELQSVMAANAFFVDFYSQWEGVTCEVIRALIRGFEQPEWDQSVPVLAALARGFRRAAADAQRLQARLSALKQHAPTAAIADRVLVHLPAGTPLETTVHITIDGFNGGFQYRDALGLSLLSKASDDPARFVSGVAHELHHVGFQYWVDHDPIRRAILGEHLGRAVAVRHVQNLLGEGLAIVYCSPEMMTGGGMGASGAKWAVYRGQEVALFERAEDLLRRSLAPGADFETCSRALEAIAIDPEGVLPVAHYVGARMVEVMDRHIAHERIIRCVISLQDFLPLYNQAARATGAFVYDPAAVARFSQIWTGDGKS